MRADRGASMYVEAVLNLAIRRLGRADFVRVLEIRKRQYGLLPLRERLGAYLREYPSADVREQEFRQLVIQLGQWVRETGE